MSLPERRFPIHRSNVEFDPEYHAAVGRALEEMAKDDPSMRKFYEAWCESNAMIDQWEQEAQERAAPAASETPASVADSAVPVQAVRKAA